MPRKFKIRKIGLASADVMSRAVQLVLEEGHSIRIAAERMNVKYQTLARYVKKKRENPDTEISMEPNYNHRQIFSDKEEKILANYLQTCSSMAYGLSTNDTRRLAYEVAIQNNLAIPKSWTVSKMAGKDWLRAFLKRRKTLSIRKPEACSLSRLTSFNRHNVGVFFENLRSLLERCPNVANPARIYNLDETGTTTVQNPKKIIATKGVKQVNHCTSGERGELVTTCAIVSAIGTYIPPVLVFPRKFFKPHMLNQAPPGSIGLATPSGWMNSELFEQVLEHFIQHSNSSKDNPSLLIYDNHESHISINIVNKAREAGVQILTLPPHCSNRLQPLDVSVFGPFKAYFNAACDTWMLKNPGVPLTIYNISEAIAEAYGKAFTPNNILSGFRKTGIHPFDPSIFTDADFLSSAVTDRPVDVPVDDPSQETVLNNFARHDVAPSHSRHVTPARTLPEVRSSTPVDLVVDGTFITPEQIRGYPKAQPRKTSKRNNRRKGRSTVITDAPEIRLLIERETQKSISKKNKDNLKLLQAKDKSNQRKRKQTQKNEHNFDSTSEGEDIEYEEFSQTWKPKNIDDEEVRYDSISQGKFVLVEFPGKVCYVGKILSCEESDEFKVSYLRKSGKFDNCFVFPNVADEASITKGDIFMILPQPLPQKTKRQANIFKFPMDFHDLNIR